MMLSMNDAQVGRSLRALRHRRRWRQEDVGATAGVSQHLVSLAERGRIDAMSLRHLRSLAVALDADVVVTIRWRAGDLDRLLDEGHAAMVGLVSERLERLGWDTRPEVTYSIYGERGSIDLLAWHAATRTLLVVEVKTELTSVEETLRKHDAKVRLAKQIGEERYGWRAAGVARLLVLPDAATPRRRVERHSAVLRRAYPLRGAAARGWLKAPDGASGSVLFVGHARTRASVARKRIRGRATGADQTV
jgi:transcriptional regulator with XRE-family HTH domain